MEINNIFESSATFIKDDILIKTQGVVFTQKHICDKIVELTKPKITDIICEPSVGKGSFVFSLLEYFRRQHTLSEIIYFIENNLFCYEIDQKFIDDYKNLLKDYIEIIGYTEDFNINVYCEDFLYTTKTFDLIIGNPPYIKIQNLDKEYLEQLKINYDSLKKGSVDIYFAFIEKALMSSERFAYIIPNSFIKNKSGKFIRNILKDRIEYIYDFEFEHVWDNISTYNCIILANNFDKRYIEYKTKNDSISVLKSNIIDDNWNFSYESENKNRLSYLINYYNCELATLKDSVYLMDYSDDVYCYKNNYKIEKNACKKLIKASKSKTFSDHKWIIYPYDINIDDYPYLKKYLLDHKPILMMRDKGKIKEENWFLYGRKQGLMKDRIGKRIIIPKIFLRSNKLHHIDIPNNDDCVVFSGILLDIPEENYEKVLSIITSEDFYNFCESNNKIMSGGWLTISTKTIMNYLY
jgi:hypothetical protein